MAAAGALLLAASLVGCTGSDPEPTPLEPADSESASATTDASLERFYEQDVEWEECRSEMECAEVEVPLDYTDPEGGAITLSLLKVAARGPPGRRAAGEPRRTGRLGCGLRGCRGELLR